MFSRHALSMLFLMFLAASFLLTIGSSSMVAQAELPSPSATPTPVDKRFGAIESFWAPQQAAELGVGWERILFYWNEIQPSDADDWNTLHVLEEWLVEASEHDRLVVGLLKNTPAWATDGPPFSGLPRGLYLPVDDPDNLWANYVRQIVEYYGPRGVHHWIIWNEPEIGAGVYGHEFDGSVEDYIRLLQVAYLVAKEHDPEAVIHLAGYSYWHDPDYLVEFMETLTSMPEAAENEYYFDVFSLHIYFRVETVFELVNFVDELQNSYGIDKPIWINETNAAPNLDPFWPVERPQFQVDLDQQAWYLVQAYGLGFAAGAESVAVYKLIDILLPEGGESFGILRPDFSQRPAYLAYRTTNRLLSGFSWPVDIQEHADYTIVSFHKGDLHGDELIRLLWARRDVALTLSVPANAESGQLIDYTGQSKSVHVQEGRYIISLDGARCRDQCDIGGPPLFLVETIDRDALPEMGDEVPVVRATLTATAEVSPTFTPWPTDTPTPSPTATQTPTATMTPTPTVTKTPTPSQTPTFSAAATDEPSTTPSVSGEPASSTAIPLSEPDLPPPVTAEQAPGSFVFLGAGVVALVVLMLLLRGRRSIN